MKQEMDRKWGCEENEESLPRYSNNIVLVLFIYLYCCSAYRALLGIRAPLYKSVAVIKHFTSSKLLYKG